eukprot:TRINITY_DN1810_c0_g2_i1.p4 TRINITY_DN1810_c0_g2~~TRINITY_DN1810_c0_g2_i1.p4  ORF type:complete len:127 (+),score=15.64 TRINITY_DN1810_c0_g2_i1:221-601(+)
MYNIFTRKGEEKLFPLLKKEKISFYASFSPLASGLFNYSSKDQATSSGVSVRYGKPGFVSTVYGNLFFKESLLKVISIILSSSAKMATLSFWELQRSRNSRLTCPISGRELCLPTSRDSWKISGRE